MRGQTRRGRYSYANGVLLMAWDGFQVREALNWVKDRRFTYFSDEMLIFERDADAGAATESAQGSEKGGGMRDEKKSVSPHPSSLNPHPSPERPFPAPGVHPAKEPSAKWVIATVLIGVACVFVLVAIKIYVQRHPTNSTAIRTGEVTQATLLNCSSPSGEGECPP